MQYPPSQKGNAVINISTHRPPCQVRNAAAEPRLYEPDDSACCPNCGHILIDKDAAYWTSNPEGIARWLRGIEQDAEG